MSTTYLAGALLTMLVWYILYMRRRDVHKEMLFMSVLAAAAFTSMQWFFWTKGWVKPLTMTGTLVGPEDVLYGFGMGGIAAAVYEELFEQRKKARRERHKEKHHTRELLLLVGLSVLIACVLFFGLHFSPGMAWTLAVLAPVFWIWILRRDLITPSLLTGGILAIFAVIVFGVMDWLEPGFIMRWWGLESLSPDALRGPLEDVGWTFTAGMFLGCVYEFWEGIRFHRMSR